MIASSANPPTTPPTIAATFGCCVTETNVSYHEFITYIALKKQQRDLVLRTRVPINIIVGYKYFVKYQNIRKTDMYVHMCG